MRLYVPPPMSSHRADHPVTSDTARTWVEVDLGRIAANVDTLRRRLPEGTGILMTVKADAYGHGLVPVARAAMRAGVWGLGVAALSEAAALRDAGIEGAIVCLMPTLPEEAERVVALGVTPAISFWEQATALADAARRAGRRLPVHVEVDTGMHRAGAPDRAAVELVVRIHNELQALDVDGIFTHFASADEADPGFTGQQLDRFDALLAALAERGIRPAHVHAANSAAALRFRRAARALVRPGIALYGAPGEIATGGDAGWRGESAFPPALAWRARVVGVKELAPGDAVSYHRRYVAPAAERVAILAVGYGDGWPFALSNRGSVLLRGRAARIRGAVCMDLTMVDATPFPDLAAGEIATLIGEDGGARQSVEDVGRVSGLMSYAVLTGIGNRVPRIYREASEA
jgi:alanine racemase